MNLTIFSREPHHTEHARAIADRLGLNVESDINKISTDYVCVFCYGDLKLVNSIKCYPKKKIIFCEHGVGMFYDNINHPSYAGSNKDRENVVLRLSPNATHAQKERETLTCPIEVIGVPKLDKYANKHWRVKTFKPVVAVSFHWDCLVCQETRTSFRHFVSGLKKLAETFEVIGHGHPRIIKNLIPYYRKYGIKVVHDFDTIMRKADVYICDNSSTIYEWCITRKPLVLLNPPFYRKDVHYTGNPRFWKHADIAPLCERPEDLVDCVNRALERKEYLPKIELAVKDVLTFDDGKSADRAVEAIKKIIQ